jgi:hypothetical protein
MSEKQKINVGDLVLVRWEDHASESGWSIIDETFHTLCTVNTVGWVVRNDKKYITLSFMKQEYNNVVGDRLTIIKSCITKIKKIQGGE